ncbi:MAG: YicC family protein [Gammaproteobacteria bacterium]|nr:YicC family protein [Gammaproteobacteria bacterium]MDH5799556.1 YicC family protein [Gammaproteobacteria bacterium]
MIYSMTAFARQSADGELGQLTIEIKSVNHRFSEVSLRIPEDLRFLEQKIRDAIGASVKRGKVDCNFKYQAPLIQGNSLNLNKSLILALSRANAEIDTLTETRPAKGFDYLKWPGVIETPQQDMEKTQSWVLAMLETALSELLESRAREGEKLKAMILERCQAMEQHTAAVVQRMPVALQSMRQRLTEKLEELRSQLDDSRLEQEMVLLANKADVSEEMDRLTAHISEVRRVIQQGSPAGRRLDFLMQEMNREANTLGSKSIDTELTKASIELKVLIEQMREQIQNIE